MSKITNTDEHGRLWSYDVSDGLWIHGTLIVSHLHAALWTWWDTASDKPMADPLIDALEAMNAAGMDVAP